MLPRPVLAVTEASDVDTAIVLSAWLAPATRTRAQCVIWMYLLSQYSPSIPTSSPTSRSGK